MANTTIDDEFEDTAFGLGEDEFMERTDELVEKLEDACADEENAGVTCMALSSALAINLADMAKSNGIPIETVLEASIDTIKDLIGAMNEQASKKHLN